MDRDKIGGLVEAYGSECSKGNEYDNRPNIKRAKKELMDEIFKPDFNENAAGVFRKLKRIKKIGMFGRVKKK